MKKRIFALALALCMMLSVMPNAFANGVLTLGDGTGTDSNGVLTLDNGTSGRSTTTSGSVQPRQDGVLYGSGSEGGQSDYDFGTATDNSQTSMTINTGNTSTAQNNSTGNSVTRAETASDRLSAVEPVEPDKNQLTVSKKISETLQDSNNDPYYKIDLAAEAISNIVVETKATAIDVILILDRSSNMTADRMNGLITAINGDATTKGFLETVKEKAADSRVALVSYADAGYSTIDSAGGSTTNAFVKLSVDADYAKLRGAVSGLSSRVGGDAYSDEAFEKAAKIFQAVPTSDENYKNPRIVIFFTAGIPGEYGENDGWEYHTSGSGFLAADIYPAYNVAQESIHWGVILKAGKGTSVNLDLSQEFWTWWGHGDSTSSSSTFSGATTGCGATIYCVGLELDGCAHSGKHSYTTDCPGTRTNEYLYRISSHRPDGSHVEGNKRYNEWEATQYQEDWGSSYKDEYTRNLKDSFASAPASYYQVGDIEDIGSMFEEINVNVEQNQPIAGVVMRDYLAPGFVPCDSNGNALSVGQTIVNNGYVGTVKQDGDVYYIEWASTTMNPGEEIDASIYVKPVDTLGGRDAKTNIYGPSGLYSDDTLFASFPAPDVDVPVKEIVPNAQSFTIYLSNEADLAGLVKLDDRLDGKKNAGVSVTYTIMDGENPVASYTVAKGAVATAFPSEIVENLETCKTYTVVCTVDGDSASDADANYRKVSENTSTVHVVKPQLTFTDVNVYLGKSPSFAEPTVSWVSTSGDTCGTPSGTVPTIQCTLANKEAHYLADTTVTPTANLTGTGTPRSVAQKAFNVFVYAPVVTYQDTTIYLGENANFEKDSGETATANLVSTAWEHDGAAADTSKMGAAPELAFNYSKSETGLTVCTDVYVKAVGVDGNASLTVGETTYDYADFTTFVNDDDETEGVQFTVHVVKPVFTNTDTTIYLGNTTDLNERMIEADKWICDGTCGDQQSLEHSKLEDGETVRVAPAVTYTFTGTNVDEDGVADPEDCTTYKSETSVGGVPVKQKDEQVIVHVLKPQLSVSDAYIYQGQTTGLDNRISVCEKASWIDTKNDGTSSNIEGEPDMDGFVYTFTDVKSKDAYTADTCTPITVATAKINGKDVMTYFEDTGFIVHVLKPTFTVNTTDLWADYGTNVDLYMGGENYSAIDAVTNVSHTWVYTGDCSGDGVHPAELPAGTPTAPAITLNEVTFAEGDSYEVGTTDGTVTVNSVKYTSSAAGEKETDTDLVVTKNGEVTKSVTIHVNKFDLTISKSWMDGEKAADGTYKQDAIFTVSGGLGDFQVVLPAGDADVTVTSLLCGQTYTVTEDDNWTWRWDSDNAVKTITGDPHDVSTTDPHDAEHDEEVSFVNSLAKRLWLSFCTFVKNIFGQAAIQKGGSF